MKKIAIAAALFGAATIAHPALADSGEKKGIYVQHDDLDLSSEKGREIFERRVEKAARKVCGMDGIRTGTRIRSQEAKDCYAQASKAARAKVAAVLDAASQS